MAKRGKLLGNIANSILGVAGLLGSIAVGGLFIDGTTLANPVLSFLLPATAHPFFGWVLMWGYGLGLVVMILDWLMNL